MNARKFFLAGCLIAVGMTAFAQNDQYQKKVFVSSSGKEMPYRLLLPADYDSTKQYPLVLFLHGAGERGSDNEKQLVHGSGMFLNPVNRENYPAIVIFPQCPESQSWIQHGRSKDGAGNVGFPLDPPISDSFVLVNELLEHFLSSGHVDSRRLYVIGLSMGAMGTYDLICRYPGRFAAAVAICGGISPERLSAVKGTKIRIFHGDADNVVSVENSRKVYRRLRELGIKARYTEFAGCDHNSWNPAFNEPDFMSWLFAQKLKQ